MYTRKSFSSTRGLVTLSLVAVLLGYGIAAGEGGNTMADQPSARQQTERETFSPTDLTIRRATQLIGEPLKNAQGETLGTIYDLVLTSELDQISYVALSRGGLFGIGRSLHAIPWSTMRLGTGGSYIAPITTDELTQWRGFRSSAWPSEPARSWVRGAARPVEERQTAEERRSVQERRVSRIRGSMVKTPEGLSAGNIHDLVVTMDNGRILYTIVSFGGFFGLGQQQAAVPQGAIDLQPDQRVAQVNVSREVLRENAFAAGRYPDLGDPSYARNINQAFGTQPGPDWTVLGFVPAEEADREPRAPMTERTPDATRRAPAVGGIEAIRIDPQARFDPAAIKTVEGVVTMVGKSAHVESSPDILLLHVRTDTGELLTVHAGPINYVSKQDFYAVAGDRVSVTGAPVRGDSPVFLAARISKDGQVLTLRNRDGEPVWERSSESVQKPDATTPTPEQHGEGLSHEKGTSEQI